MTSRPVVACIADLSSGRSVARIAGALARRLAARLVLATVQQPAPTLASAEDITPLLMRHGRSLLTSAAGGLEYPTDVRVTLGEPAERLLAVAQREAAQLVVVSAPRQSAAEPLALGNVHLALASTAPCPVIIVPARVSDMEVDGPIVCGVDGSDRSQGAAELAADLAGRLESSLVLVHAVPATAPGFRGGYGAAEGGRDDSAARILQHCAALLPEGIPKRLLVEHGPPAKRLAAVAKREVAQFLVTGSRGRGRMSSVLLGSVASELARDATRPLVVVPARYGRGRTSAVAVRHLRSGAAVLCVHGAIDATTARDVEGKAERLLADTGGRLVVDLSDSPMIDSTAARLAEALARHVSKVGGRLAIVTHTDEDADALDGFPYAVTSALDAAIDTVNERVTRINASRLPSASVWTDTSAHRAPLFRRTGAARQARRPT